MLAPDEARGLGQVLCLIDHLHLWAAQSTQAVSGRQRSGGLKTGLVYLDIEIEGRSGQIAAPSEKNGLNFSGASQCGQRASKRVSAKAVPGRSRQGDWSGATWALKAWTTAMIPSGV